MKIASRILSLLIIAIMTTVYMGCKKDDDNEQTQEEVQLNKLKGDWTLEIASDGTPRTEDFEGLVLTLGGNYVQNGIYNYSLTGTRPNPSPWPADGTWKFGTDKLRELVRDPTTEHETEMTYSVNDTDLIISFNVPDGDPGWAGSRVSSVGGDWTFTFSRN